MYESICESDVKRLFSSKYMNVFAIPMEKGYFPKKLWKHLQVNYKKLISYKGQDLVVGM